MSHTFSGPIIRDLFALLEQTPAPVVLYVSSTDRPTLYALQPNGTYHEARAQSSSYIFEATNIPVMAHIHDGLVYFSPYERSDDLRAMIDELRETIQELTMKVDTLYR